MYSDTHFHFHYIDETDGLKSAVSVFEKMASTNVYFGMDIGTKCDDLISRRDGIAKIINSISDSSAKKRVEDFIYFSAGIWPDVESIKDRTGAMETLENQIQEFKSGNIFSDRLCAIGEGGIDHHWNPSGADGRCEKDFDEEIYNGEKELFAMQLDLSRRMDLPYIVHSRDGYKDTLDVIKSVGWNKGIIHCYSYGIEEAKQFLDSGWYISFSGAVTYVKKSKIEEMKALLNYVPEDRILLETDSPYLAPVPLRGTMNNPSNVMHTYNFVASMRNVSVEDLCNTVDSNCKILFKL